MFVIISDLCLSPVVVGKELNLQHGRSDGRVLNYTIAPESMFVNC